MATNAIIITYQKAYEIYKQLNLAQKRVQDRGKSDFEIIEDILHHEGVELIKFSDTNLDPERLVSFCVLLLPIHFYGFEKVQSMSEIRNICAKKSVLDWKSIKKLLSVLSVLSLATVQSAVLSMVLAHYH